ncbi:MAG: alpha/beta hydrolase [Novosphingobium sp.]|uniref:alpha/beta fold hydrolase n=1 Tax=Novosphingobium sp. TaxID=1874826 RepID=UPI003016BFEC
MAWRMGLLAALGALVPLAASAAPVSVPESAYTQPQQKVEVEPGRSLNLYCTGQGSPIVLLDAGAGGGILDWRRVQGEIGKVTRTCAYDRAGHGHSDPLTAPADVATTVEDIHRLIKTADLGAPLIYVGHSIAGLYGVYLQGKYPGDVAAEVLVDPSFAHHNQALQLPGKPDLLAQSLADYLTGTQRCVALAIAGRLSPPKDKPAKDCLEIGDAPDLADPGVRGEILRQIADGNVGFANLSEALNFLLPSPFDIDDRQMDALTVSFGAKPLHVLTAATPVMPGATPADLAYLHAVLSASHARIAALSTRSSHSEVADSAHYIQIDQPAAVISAVRAAIDEVRAAK